MAHQSDTSPNTQPYFRTGPLARFDETQADHGMQSFEQEALTVAVLEKVLASAFLKKS
jgi:hypothetical protein